MILLSARHAKHFLMIVLATAILIITGALAVSAVVDPYAMHRTTNIAGFNIHKPAIHHRVRMAKAYDVRRVKPRTIILGSSRSHVGIRPSHPAWPADGWPVYNLAFDGATTKEMEAYLRHAHAMQPLRRVLLGLDTYHLTTDAGSTRPDFDDQLLLQDDSAWSRARVALADLKLLISYDTLAESITTVRVQTHGLANWFAADGQRLGEIFFRQRHEPYQALGPRAYFDQIDKDEIRYKLEWRIPQKLARNGKQSPNTQPDRITSLGHIQRIVEFCRAHDIELIVYITPSHAHQQEIAAATGEWPTIESGKRALVKLLAEDASRIPQRSPFQLYDFSGYSSITTEDLPVDSRTEMRYYWESSHFKAEAGDLVLSRVFNAGAVPDDFGARLDSDSIESFLMTTRVKQQLYRASHSENVTRIQRNVSEFKQRHRIAD